MTGTVTIFDDHRRSGVISTRDGLRVRFDSNSVLAYDITVLAVGQSVTFDVVRGNDPRATNVCVERPYARRTGESRESTAPRYVGFEQNGNMRRYRFEEALNRQNRTFMVNADMALFARHQVAIQEGPALCLHLLLAAIDISDCTPPRSPAYALGDREMLVYLENHPVKQPRHKLASASLAALPIQSHSPTRE